MNAYQLAILRAANQAEQRLVEAKRLTTGERLEIVILRRLADSVLRRLRYSEIQEKSA